MFRGDREGGVSRLRIKQQQVYRSTEFEGSITEPNSALEPCTTNDTQVSIVFSPAPPNAATFPARCSNADLLRDSAFSLEEDIILAGPRAAPPDETYPCATCRLSSDIATLATGRIFTSKSLIYFPFPFKKKGGSEARGGG